jgi:hypothetical protein
MTDKTHEEQLALLRADTDQAREAMREVARMLASLRAELLDSGFTQTEALILCGQAMISFISGGKSND